MMPHLLPALQVEKEIFVAMSKALAFIDPERLSATVVLTALNRFLRETDGSKNAFLDGNFPERLCQPLADYIEARGGKARTLPCAFCTHTAQFTAALLGASVVDQGRMITTTAPSDAQ